MTCSTPACSTRVQSPGPCWYCRRALSAITRKLQPPITRTAECRWCGDPFTYLSRVKRAVCDVCRSSKASNARHRDGIEVVIPGAPDHGLPGYRCVLSAFPCPRTDCRHHLPAGSTCSIREANEHGAMTLVQVARVLGGELTRERIRQIESIAIRKIRRSNKAVAKALCEAVRE
jgi:hypothetical protein